VFGVPDGKLALLSGAVATCTGPSEHGSKDMDARLNRRLRSAEWGAANGAGCSAQTVDSTGFEDALWGRRLRSGVDVSTVQNEVLHALGIEKPAAPEQLTLL